MLADTQTIGELWAERDQRDAAERERSREEWARRKAAALALADDSATAAEVAELTPLGILVPARMALVEWACRERGLALPHGAGELVGLIVRCVERYRGVHVSGADLAQRIRTSSRTLRRILAALDVDGLDIVRRVPVYRDCEAYRGRQTKRGGGSSGKAYSCRQRPNAYTLGDVGKALFGRHVSRHQDVVDSLCVASDYLTRPAWPGNRSICRNDLYQSARALLVEKARRKPANQPSLTLIARENVALARTRQLARELRLIE